MQTYYEGNIAYAQDWIATWGPERSEKIVSITHDDDGNIYAIGYMFKNNTQLYDIIIKKYTSQGSLVWNVTWGVALSKEIPYEAEVGWNRLYIVGQIENNSGEYGLILEYDLNGNYIDHDTVRGDLLVGAYTNLAITSQYIYVLGQAIDTCIIVKYTDALIPLLNKTVMNIYSDIVASDNQIYITGKTHVIAFDNNLKSLWIKYIPSEFTSITSITIDPNSDMLFIAMAKNDYEYYVSMYYSNSSMAWIRKISNNYLSIKPILLFDNINKTVDVILGSTHSNLSILSLSMNNESLTERVCTFDVLVDVQDIIILSNNFVILAYQLESGYINYNNYPKSMIYFLKILGNSLLPAWTKSFFFTLNIPKKIAIDNYGNLIVVGETSKRTEQTESREYDWSTSIFLLKYSSTGDLIDEEYWFDNQYTNIVIYDVTADNKTGYVYIIGKYTKKMDGSSQNMLFLIYYDGHELKTIGTIPINPYLIKTKIDANNRRLLLAYMTCTTENEINIIQYDISSTFNSSIINYLQNISYSNSYRIRDFDFSIDTYGNVYLASAASYGVTTYVFVSKISLNGSILWHTYKDIETTSIYYLETMLVEKTFYVIVSFTEAIVIGYTSEGDMGTYTSFPTKFHMINDGYIYANGSDHILSVIEGASTSSAILELYSINNHTKVSSYEFYSRGILCDVDWMYWVSGVSLYVSNRYIYVTLILSLQRYAKSDIRFCTYDNLIVVTMRLSIDSDGDGLSDYLESIIGTDPHDPDTDDDGYLDGYEYFELGTDPLTSDRAYIFDLTTLMLLLAPIFLILSISLIARKTKQKTGKLQKAKKQQKKNELKQSIQQKTKDYSKIYNEFLKAHGKIDLNILDRVDAQHRKKFSLWIAEKLLNERKNELAKDFFIQAEEYNRAVSLIISLALYYRSKGEINKAKELYLEAAELLKKLNRHAEANEIVKKAKELS